MVILLLSVNSYATDTFTIKDMRGTDVTIPQNLERVATIDDGFIEGVMTHLGVINKVIAIGSWSMKRDYKYDCLTDVRVSVSVQTTQGISLHCRLP